MKFEMDESDVKAIAAAVSQQYFAAIAGVKT